MHRIRRQILDLELPREAGAVALQRQVGRVFQEKVLPRLDELFTQIAPTGHYVRLERLEIDLGTLGASNWERDFVERCIEQVSRQVAELAVPETASEHPIRVQSPEARAWAVFGHFLDTGMLPWYAEGMTLADMAATIRARAAERPEDARRELLLRLKKNASVLQRLVWQFGPEFAHDLLETVLGLSPGWIEQAVRLREAQVGRALDSAQRVALLRPLIEASAPSAAQVPPAPAVVAAWFSQDTDTPAPDSRPHAARPSSPTPAAGQADQAHSVADEAAPHRNNEPQAAAVAGLAVSSTGLVLLAPYLPAFLVELNCLEGDHFPGPDAQYRALHLLHYLAVGQENPEEPTLILPKILCGLELEEPVPLELALTDIEKQECEHLLQAVVRNWPALKNTSPDGLRAGFLQRKGLATWQPERFAWLLRVERLGQDILLERLPWGFSVVKLPWMPTMIQVEW